MMHKADVFAILFLCGIISLSFRDLLSDNRHWLLVLDDGDNFIKNPHVLGLSWKNIVWAFNDGAVLGVYEPFGWIFKMTVLEIANRTYSQEATALASFLLHLLGSILSYFYSCRIVSYLFMSNHINKTKEIENNNIQSRDRVNISLSCLVGVILTFAHPQRAEAVGWLSAQGYPLATVFLLLSVHFQMTFLFRKLEYGKSDTFSTLNFMQSLVIDQFSIFKFLSVICFSLACLSKGAATSACGCFAVIEYVIIIVHHQRKGEDLTTSQQKLQDAKNIKQRKREEPSQSSSFVLLLFSKKLWFTVLQSVLHQIDSLAIALFVAQRTVQATSQQTTCGFANDYRKLTSPERLLVALATPLQHIHSFLQPLESSIEVYYPKESLEGSRYYRFGAAIGTVVLALSLLKLVHLGCSGSATKYDAIASLYVTYVLALVSTLGVIGSSGDHLCYLTADRYSYIAFTLIMPIALSLPMLSALTRTSFPFSSSFSLSHSQKSRPLLWLSIILLSIFLVIGTTPPLHSFRTDSTHYRRAVLLSISILLSSYFTHMH